MRGNNFKACAERLTQCRLNLIRNNTFVINSGNYYILSEIEQIFSHSKTGMFCLIPTYAII